MRGALNSTKILDNSFKYIHPVHSLQKQRAPAEMPRWGWWGWQWQWVWISEIHGNYVNFVGRKEQWRRWFSIIILTPLVNLPNLSLRFLSISYKLNNILQYPKLNIKSAENISLFYMHGLYNNYIIITLMCIRVELGWGHWLQSIIGCATIFTLNVSKLYITSPFYLFNVIFTEQCMFECHKN